MGPQCTRTSTQIRSRARPHGRRKWKKPAGGSSERGKRKLLPGPGVVCSFLPVTSHATHDVDCLLPAPVAVGSGRRARTSLSLPPEAHAIRRARVHMVVVVPAGGVVVAVPDRLPDGRLLPLVGLGAFCAAGRTAPSTRSLAPCYYSTARFLALTRNANMQNKTKHCRGGAHDAVEVGRACPLFFSPWGRSEPASHGNTRAGMSHARRSSHPDTPPDRTRRDHDRDGTDRTLAAHHTRDASPV